MILEFTTQIRPEHLHLFKDFEIELIPQLPGRPRWAGRPECIDMYKVKIEVDYEGTLDLNDSTDTTTEA